MKTVILLATLIVYGLSLPGPFVKFETMLNKVVGKDVMAEYSPYGCYCGQSGKGIPQDATDRCCWMHRCCYEALKRHKCDTVRKSYLYTYENESLSCGGWPSCSFLICMCDSQAALCLQKTRKSYNKKYHNLTNFQCTGKSPEC